MYLVCLISEDEKYSSNVNLTSDVSKVYHWKSVYPNSVIFKMDDVPQIKNVTAEFTVVE